MGLLGFMADTIKTDLFPKQKNSSSRADKFKNIRNRPIVIIDKPKDVTIQTLRKHPNYYKVKDAIMRCVICNIDTTLSCRELAEILGIGKSSISRQLQVLKQEGYIQKVQMGLSNRSIYYKILVSKEDAILYREMFSPAGRKKNKKF